MHSTDPIVLPEVDNGLRMVSWTALGFDELRRREILSHKCEFELVDGLVLHRESWSSRHDRVVAELAERLGKLGGGRRTAVNDELRLDELDSVVTPDITVMGADGGPVLLVEVSHTAPRLDGREKERLYARAEIPAYWHIDLAWNVWQTHSPPHREGYGCRGSGPAYRSTLTMLDGWTDISLDELLAAADARA